MSQLLFPIVHPPFTIVQVAPVNAEGVQNLCFYLAQPCIARQGQRSFEVELGCLFPLLRRSDGPSPLAVGHRLDTAVLDVLSQADRRPGRGGGLVVFADPVQ